MRSMAGAAMALACPCTTAVLMLKLARIAPRVARSLGAIAAGAPIAVSVLAQMPAAGAGGAMQKIAVNSFSPLPSAKSPVPMILAQRSLGSLEGVGVALVMLYFAGCSPFFWREFCRTATKVREMSPPYG